MGGFDEQSVGTNGGVAWAKQVAQSMYPDALDTQIQNYQQAAGQLRNVQATLQNVKNNLAASWMGDAADQAQASFQTSIDQAVTAHDTIQAVVPPLQNAKAAQTEFVSTMNGIPNEKPVPSNSLGDEASNFFFGTPLPSQVAEQHNTAVRGQTASALNKLSSSYESSANQMNVVATGGPTGSTGGTNYVPEVGAAASGNGLASGYNESVAGGATYKAGLVSDGAGPGAGIADPSAPPTAVSGLEPVPMPVGGGGSDPIEFPVEPEPEPTPIGGGTGLITDEPPIDGEAGPGLPGETMEGEGEVGFGSKAGVFDEHGFSDGQLTGGRGSGSGTKLRNAALGDGEEEVHAGRGGGVIGEGEGESSESMMGGAGRGGRGGGLGGEEEESSTSSKYSRGRFFDGEAEMRERPARSSVRSVFENATDGEGNKVDMMGGRRGSMGGEDEEEERAKRPKYLTEDEFWDGAQRVVPPLIQ